MSKWLLPMHSIAGFQGNLRRTSSPNMLEYLASSTEWLQQHVVHLLLRRKLAHLFEDPVDLAQLTVQLRKHEQHAGMRWTARLSNVRLSTAALSQHLVESGFEVTGAHVRSLDIAISFKGPSVSAKLSGVDVCLQPAVHGLANPTDDTVVSQSQSQGAKASMQSPDPDGSTDGFFGDLKRRANDVAAAVGKLLNTISVRLDDVRLHVRLQPQLGNEPQRARNSANMSTTSPTPRRSTIASAALSVGAGTRLETAADSGCIAMYIGCIRAVDSTDWSTGRPTELGRAEQRRRLHCEKTVLWDGLSVRACEHCTCTAPGGTSEASLGEPPPSTDAKGAGSESDAETDSCPDEDGDRFFAAPEPPLAVSPALNGHPQRPGTLLVTGTGPKGLSGRLTLALQWATEQRRGTLEQMDLHVSASAGVLVPLHADTLAPLLRVVAQGQALAQRLAERRRHEGAMRLTESVVGALQPADGLAEAAAVAAADLAREEALAMRGVRGDDDARPPAPPSEAAAPALAPHEASAAAADASVRASRALLWQSQCVASSEATCQHPQHISDDLRWTVHVSLGGDAGHDGRKELPSEPGLRTGDGLMLQMWDRLGSRAEALGLAGSDSTAGSYGDVEARDSFAICALVEQARVELSGFGGAIVAASAHLHGAQLCHALSDALHRAQGKFDSLQAALAVPALFQLAPSEPGPRSCATLERTNDRDARTFVIADPFTSDAPDAFMWPFACPISAEAASCALTVHTAAPHAIDLALPPYMLLASTLLLASVQQVTHTVVDAIASAAPQQSTPTATLSRSAALSDSLIVGTGGFVEASQAMPNVTVRLKRLCCVFMPSVADVVGSKHTVSHLVLDVRAGTSAGAAAECAASGAQSGPLLQVSQQHSLGSSRPAVVAALRVQSLNMYSLSTAGAIMHATCLLTLQPVPARHDAPHEAALSVRAVASAGGLDAHAAVVGDQLAAAWTQANAHRRRDWAAGSAQSLHAASRHGTGGAPAHGRLFPSAFSLEQARGIAHAGSTTKVSISVPAATAHVALDLIPEFARLCEGCAKLLRSSAAGDAAPKASSKHLVATVAGAGSVTLVGAEGVYDLKVAFADLVHGQGLCRLAGAYLTHGRAHGVHLTLTPNPGPSDQQPAALLYHIPVRSQQDDSGYDFIAVSRPAKAQPTAGALRTETIVSHAMHGVTFGAPNGDLGLSWLNRLAGALSAAIPRPDRPSAIVMADAATHLVLENVALAYMPPRNSDADADAGARGAALVALARGVHTSAVGSARYVEACDIKVALGDVRTAGAPPWGVSAPARGWDAAVCRQFGLDIVLAESALCAVLDPSAPVDSDSRAQQVGTAATGCTDKRPRSAESGNAERTAGVQLTTHGLAGGASTGAVRCVARADPLLDYVQRRHVSQSDGSGADEAAAPQHLSQSLTAFGWATAMQSQTSEMFGTCDAAASHLERSLYRSAMPHTVSAAALSSPLGASGSEPVQGTPRRLGELHRQSSERLLHRSSDKDSASERSSSGTESTHSTDSLRSIGSSSAAAALAATMYHDTHAAYSSGFDDMLSFTSSGGLGADEPATGWIGPADPLQAIAARGIAANSQQQDLQRARREGSSSTLASSDAEILTGEEAATMQLVRVSLTSTDITLWPDAMQLARRFCEQAATLVAPKGHTAATAPASFSGAGSPAVAVPADDAMCAQQGQGPCQTESSDSFGRVQHDDPLSNGAGLQPRAAAADKLHGVSPLPSNGSAMLADIGPADCDHIAVRNSAASARRPTTAGLGMEHRLARQIDTADHSLDHADTMHSALGDDCAGLAADMLTGVPRGSLTASQWHTDHSISPALGASSAMYTSVATKYVDAPSRSTSLSLSHSAAFCGVGRGYEGVMHDVQVGEQSVVAVGYPLVGSDCGAPVRNFSAAGVPTDQEEDGRVDSQFRGQTGGLQNAVCPNYVGGSVRSDPAPAGAAHTAQQDVEAIVGRLSAHYPDSATRLTATSGKLTVTLRSPPAERSNAPAGCVRATVTGLQAQHDLFPAAANCHQRFAAAAHRFAVHQQAMGKAERRQDKGAQAAPSAAAADTADLKWRPVATRLRYGPYDPRKDMLRALMRVHDEAEGGARHATVSLRLPSLRLKLTQPTVAFLQGFVQKVSSDTGDEPLPQRSPSCDGAEDSEAMERDTRSGMAEHLHASAKATKLSASADSLLMLVNIDEPKAAYATLANMLFAAVVIRPFVVVVDYHPVKADYAALREGSLQELVNLVDWANVVVRFKAATLQRVHGVRALMALICDHWIADMRSNQAVQMLEGAKPVAALVRLGTAVHDVASKAVALPSIAKGARQSGHRQQTVAARRMLHRSARHLLHALALEALGLGAWVAGGAADALGAGGVREAVEDEESEQPVQARTQLASMARNAESVRRELGAALAALIVEPVSAMRRGHGVAAAAQMAAGAVPGAVRRPIGAAAAAVQQTCVDMQHAMGVALPRQ